MTHRPGHRGQACPAKALLADVESRVLGLRLGLNTRIEAILADVEKSCFLV